MSFTHFNPTCGMFAIEWKMRTQSAFFAQLVKTLSSREHCFTPSMRCVCAYVSYSYSHSHSFSSPLNLNTRYTIFLFTLFNCDFYAAFVLMMAHLPAHSFTCACLFACSHIRQSILYWMCDAHLFAQTASERAHAHALAYTKFFRRNFYDRSFPNKSGLMGYRKEIRSSQCVQHCLCLRHFNLRKRRARESHYAYHCRPSIHPSIQFVLVPHSHKRIFKHIGIKLERRFIRRNTAQIDVLVWVPARLPNVRVCECGSTKSGMT